MSLEQHDEMAISGVRTQQSDPASGSTNGRSALARCLSLDLEVGAKDGRIHALAGVRPDTGECLTLDVSSRNRARSLARLDDLADGADFLIGHNLIDFDLPHLRAANPDLRLLRLPAVDTLRLNPLAFPRNPYHHLVKHYQDGSLKRGRVNDPELDARLALEVFSDQQKAFTAAPAELLTAWHWLTTAIGGAGFDLLFSSIRRSRRPSDVEAYAAIGACLKDAACETHTRGAKADADQHGWELAYALAWLSVAGGNSVMPPWVRHQFPGAGRLVRRLRDTACSDPRCGWCGERHDSHKELTRWFGFDDFRTEPADEEGRPPDRGGGAEIGWRHVAWPFCAPASGNPSGTSARLSQMPDLAVDFSTLVALMADQVAGLEARGIGSIALR